MSATAQLTDTPHTRTREQGRILLVADDSTSACYREPLEQAGFAVVGVSKGVAAMVELRRTRPHIVIASTHLTGVSAEELARMIAQAQSSVPLVFIGAEQSSCVRRAAALAAGAFDYFQLPAELNVLLPSISKLVKLQQTINRLRAEADRDYLTGLSNRRRFRNALGQEVERWRRYQIPCGLLIIDIDHLKLINDTHGHSAGDIAIRHVASSLTEMSRDNDTSARLGGEEFALLLAGADETKSYAAAERLREVVSATVIEPAGRITISIGVASCPAQAVSERALYAATDAALYRAKGDGRNRVCIAPSLNSPAPPVL
ncbi:MAG: GGDEF domain-containing response regulator [Pyrinomonadaceae bacterium]|nr:GGDEF domain-containing response regulator [Pyrinomonadaceae bacterium]MDQ3135825.1 GGDEF domain-containing response regulator [Acidobacteriota bacterium]